VTAKEDSPDQPAAESSGQVPDFERSLEELETLVQRMEKGDLSLEDSLTQFERGIRLTRACEKALREAEQKVEILLEQDDADGRPAPFREDPEPAD
jgi:exodeoxyribonuclease VII small subunit